MTEGIDLRKAGDADYSSWPENLRRKELMASLGEKYVVQSSWLGLLQEGPTKFLGYAVHHYDFPDMLPVTFPSNVTPSQIREHYTVLKR